MNEDLRRRVRSRADDRCEYCRLPQSGVPYLPFHLEHIRARQHHGADDLDNLALACPWCNRFKGPNLSGVDPVTDALVPLFNPRTQEWDEHFAMVGIEVMGLTEVGRATCDLLRMNDQERLLVREESEDASS